MLEIFFCNVGDGDAILLRERREAAKDFTVLVDAGRPFVEPAQGSFRKEAIYFLKAQGVDHIDRMYLTHLHIDHIGGAQRILKAIPTERLYALYLPPADAGWITPSFTSVEKTENGVKHDFVTFPNSGHALLNDPDCTLRFQSLATQYITTYLG